MKRLMLSEEAVRDVFANATDQADYLIALYKMVFPQWDDIDKVEGWPSVNDWTWKTIARLAMEADRRLRLDVMAGGAWMNSGFSTSHGEALANWQVSLVGVVLKMKMIPA